MPKAAPTKSAGATQKPKAPKEPRAGPSSGRRGPAPGPGKQPKVFSETLGLQHLLALTQEVTAKEDAKLQSRLQRNRDSAEWAKRERLRREEERLAKKGKGPQAKRKAEAAAAAAAAEDDGAEEQETRRPAQVQSAPLQTKSAIRASLLAEQRAKAKARKGARKAAAKRAADPDAVSPPPDGPPKKKRVAFA